MVFYIEACESGSMMVALPGNINGESLETKQGERWGSSEDDESVDGPFRPEPHQVEFTFVFWSTFPLNSSSVFERLLWKLPITGVTSVFQSTPPPRPTLTSRLTPAITTRRGTHTWETGTASTGWRTRIRRAPHFFYFYQIFLSITTKLQFLFR